MNLIDLYAREARKHHLSYGQYDREVEHGRLPPPVIPESEKPKKSTPYPIPTDTAGIYKHTCERCFNPFYVSSRHSRAMYCPNCRDIRRKKDTGRKQHDTRATCTICGEEFDRGRDIRGVINNRKMCDRCRGLWHGLNVEAKRKFAACGRTFEALEGLSHGNKKNR